MRKILIVTAVVAVLAAVVPIVVNASSEPFAVLRVDQVGFAPDEAKPAYLMASRDVADKRFSVLDESGRTVLSGILSASSRPWNDRYRVVRVADLSALSSPGRYLVEAGGARSDWFRVAPRQELLRPLVSSTTSFFRAQRDGAEVDPNLLRRKPSHLADREAVVYAPPRIDMQRYELLDKALTEIGGPIDVEGGWFDAGDFLKFTHTTSYATAQLLLAQRDGATDERLAAEAMHGIRWLGKMWTGDVLHAQVGIGVGNDGLRTDHDVWRLPEDDDALDVRAGDRDFHIKHRPVFPANNPGEPVSPNLAGRVAAAFALAAQVTGERHYLDLAAAVYARADHKPRALVTAYPPEYYPETGWRDDMEFGATELALAAQRFGDDRAAGWFAEAADWATSYLDGDGRGSLGIADVSAMAHADLAPHVDGELRGRLAEDLRGHLRDAVTLAGKDPFGSGVAYWEWDSVPKTFGLVLTEAYYRGLTGDREFTAFAGRQRGWALGANPWGRSFVIGAGTRTLDCPSHAIANLTGQSPVGAVVNGPNAAEQFKELNTFPTMRACPADGSNALAEFDGAGARFLDHVGAWASAEVAIDFTSTALLAFALSAR